MKRKGFTLIELLVVISIISLLSSVVLAALTEARSRARDARALSEINEIRNALELYRVDKGLYPHYNGGDIYYYAFSEPSRPCGHTASTKSPEGAWCDLEKVLSPYIADLPRSSRGFSKEYLYRSWNGNSYALKVTLENPGSGPAANDGGIYNNFYEVGDLRSCTNWISWSGSICQD